MSSGVEPVRKSSSEKICAWGKYAIIGVIAFTVVLLVSDTAMAPPPSPPSPVAAPPFGPGSERGAEMRGRRAFSEYVQLAQRRLNCSQLETLHDTISQAKSAIWDEWNVTHYPNFLATMHIPQQSWDIQRAKFVQLLLDGSQHDANSDSNAFVVSFSGSSVTAGHDNYFRDAYPAVFYDTLRPVFASWGKRLVVRNQAIGNNPCYPYDACVETHLGSDADIISWEQSMNCGRDCRPLDTFTRSAYNLPKQPTVIYVLSGGPSWSFADCQRSNLTQFPDTFHRPDLTKGEKTLLHQPLHKSARSTSLMNSMAFLTDSQEFLLSRFASIAPMGQSIFPIADYRCYGPYNYNFSRHSAGPGAPWHPGKDAHRLRAHSLAYYLLSILSESVKNVHSITCPAENGNREIHGLSEKMSAMESGPEEERRVLEFAEAATPRRALNERSMHSLRRSLQTEKRRIAEGYPLSVSFTARDVVHALNLSGPSVDAGEVDESFRHVLATAEANSRTEGSTAEPLNRLILLSEYVSRYLTQNYHSAALPPVPARYHLDETNHRATCWTDFEPRQGAPLSSALGVSQWTRNLSFFDVSGVEKAERRGLGYRDRKYIFLSTGIGSRIEVHLRVGHPSRLWLCEVQKGFSKYPSHMADLPDGAEVTVVTQGRTMAIGLEGLTDQCYRSVQEVEAGEHLLVVTQKTDKLINLAYVVSW